MSFSIFNVGTDMSKSVGVPPDAGRSSTLKGEIEMLISSSIRIRNIYWILLPTLSQFTQVNITQLDYISIHLVPKDR